MNEMFLHLKKFAAQSSELLIVLAVAVLSYFIIKKVIVKSLARFFAKTENNYDDILMESHVFEQLAFIAPALVFIYSADLISISKHILQIIEAFIALNITITLLRLFSAFNKIYNEFDISDRRPIKGYIQMLQVVTGFIGLIVTVCMAVGKSPFGILSGLGAISAVLMFVFKDTIMSFIAGLQIMINDLVHNGDWIEMSSMGADGIVEDIALYTVKVRNFDNTIVTLPTSKLIETSFKNWRGMKEAGARRFKRSILIDVSSIRYLNSELFSDIESIPLLKTYAQELRTAGISFDDRGFNNRRLTNIGAFRTYIFEYLKAHNSIRKDMTLIVREMASDGAGQPLEIYAFVDTTVWETYEDIQSFIYEHLLAAVPIFGLSVFQHPTGKDFSKQH